MYIFWDNSNIHYAGLNQVRPVFEPNVQMELYRTYFAGLLKLVLNDRKLDGIYFAGSTPPKEDGLWAEIKKLGINPDLIPRSSTEGEANTTDHVLQNHILRLGYDVKEPGIIALLTGDGAGMKKGIGFLADAKRLADSGWKFEVYSWDAACHPDLKTFGETNGKYVKLEDYYEYITFIKGKRQAKIFEI